MRKEFTDCVWYRKPQRAAGRALELSNKTAEPMYVVEDTKTRMFGVGTGETKPPWCSEINGFRFICVINPTKH